MALFKKLIALQSLILSLLFLVSPAYAQVGNNPSGYTSAQAIQFTNLDQLLWGIVKTLQYYTLPVMALSIAILGVMLVGSADDTERKSKLKGWIFNILVGGLLVFGAATIASVLQGFLGGTPQ